MTKLTILSDCGNAPKKLVLRDLNIAFAHQRCRGHPRPFHRRHPLANRRRSRPPRQKRRPRALEAMKDTATSESIIHSIITHCNEAGKENQYGHLANRFGTKSFQT